MNKAIKIQNVEILINSDAGKLGGLGAHCQRLATGCQWSYEEDQLLINILELKTAKLVIESFYKIKNIKANSLTSLQYDNLRSLSENWRNKRRGTQKNLEGNLGVLNFEWDHTYLKKPPKLPMHSGWLLDEEYQEPEWVENVSSYKQTVLAHLFLLETF